MRRRLTDDQLARVRSVRDHAGAALRSLRSAPAPVGRPHDFADEAGTTIRRLGREWRGLTPPERDRTVRDLIALITIDSDRWRRLLEEPLVAGMLPAELYGYALGAARFASGEPGEAVEPLSVGMEEDPSPIAFLVAAGVRGSGLGDQPAAAEILDRGVERFPADAGLVQAAAVAHYRTGDTAGANALLDSVRGQLEALAGAHFANVPGLEAEIAEAGRTGATTRPSGVFGDRYNEEEAEDYWTTLYWAMTAFSPRQHPWAWLSHLYQERFSELLDDPSRDIRTFVNFGVFCAEPDRRVAERYSDVRFVGVDREQSTKRLNERAFEVPNLSFEAADILDALPGAVERSAGHVALFHGRTTTLMYPAAVRAVYRRAAELGVRYIALFENWALSRSELRYFEPDGLPRDAIACHEVMLIHDYARYLDESGYSVVESTYPVYGDLVHEPRYGADAHLYLVAELRS